jgi:cell division protein FtsN
MRTHQRQQGGTFVGIIIGLIIGLAIALGVAVAITKTPMPFANKVVKQEKTAPTANQSADPNKPLYGNRVRPVLKDEAKSEDSATADSKPAAKPEAPVPVNTAVADKPKKPEAKIAESKDPIRDIVAAKTEAKNDSKNENADLWSYFLQAGAFNDQTDADNSRAKLALMGVEARVTEKPSPNGSGILYRVRVGPFAQLEMANRVRSKLSDNGVDATIVRVAK